MPKIFHTPCSLITGSLNSDISDRPVSRVAVSQLY